jgi:hypothetical protein
MKALKVLTIALVAVLCFTAAGAQPHPSKHVKKHRHHKRHHVAKKHHVTPHHVVAHKK